jgi:signal transduction histidine kinase/DNA-binding response OmpR family regulator
MNQTNTAKEFGLYAAIVVATLGVFIGDINTPLGLAIWILYLVPLVLCLFVSRPWVPLVCALAATLFLAVGKFVSPEGVAMGIAIANRSFAGFTAWVVAYIVYTSIRNRLRVQREEWLQAARTGLSQKMAGDQTLGTLGDSILQFLAEYLGAHSGALYVEQMGVFRLSSKYALPADSGVAEQLKPGEGLAGQAAKDGRAFIASDLPETYFIGSGLGKSKPRHLLVAPAMTDDSVSGVIELAFLHPITDRETTVLDRVSESIAVAIRSSKYRTRLQELLEETQRQAEELQAQTEELRVTNEELEEQSRALKESQARLELQQNELEQTNTQLEEQTQLLEVQKEDLGRANTELERQSHDLERASRYKSDFLANMSHELRTPLNSSLILAKLLADNREGNLTPEQVRYAQTIQSAGNDLLTLITEILDLSKIESGKMDLRPEWVPVERLFSNLRQVFQPIAEQKNLDFSTTIAEGTPGGIITDPQRLDQILKNLLSNAFKFTEKGKVLLGAAPGPDETIHISVTDTGIGIAPHQQDVVFEPFRQADGTTSRRYGGTGLGLSISQELARLLGGEIHLSSEEGKGCTFTVHLPRKLDMPSGKPGAPIASRKEKPVPAQAPEPRNQPPPQETKRPNRAVDDRDRLTSSSRLVLVVEDDASFARILFDLAHELGFECLIASTAEEGLELALKFRPSAVLLDVGLPDNSGLSVLDRLKANPRTRHVPVHVVSGTDQARTAMALGAVGYMLKPVSRDELIQAFGRLEENLSHRVRRVLIVEDDPVQLESVQHLLRSAEVETIGVRTASECMEVLRKTTVDCMVLDLSLPDASGLSLLKTLTEQDNYSFPPVIVYTGKDLSAEQEETLRKYSQSIIIKGAKSPERLLDEVTLFLHQVVSELPVEKQKMLAAAHSRDAALEGKRILVAEDDVRNVFALSSILEPRGAKVRIARNGREAIEALERAQNVGEPVHLVLMDIMMPEMDGLAATREIRKRPQWKKLPVIALTAKAMKADHEMCIEAGANDYMAKPLDVEKLLSLVRVWMPR